MSQDVSVNPMIAVIDVVQNAVDYSALTDYLKTNFKKEIVFLNAHDFTDAGGRVAKTDNKSSSKGKNTTGGLTSNNSVKNIVIDPQSQAIAKGIKAKIDADLVKVLESKRKTYASFEKEKLKALSKSAKNSSNEDKANSLKSRAVIDFDELKMSLPFEGKIDILYIIVNFPYLPRQLARIIECGVDLNVFLAIVPSNFDEKENHDSQRGDEGDNTQRDASVKSPIVVQGNKKSTIPGQEFDSLQNPNVFPPLRWISLKETAPAHVIFEKVYAGDNIESTFKNIEEKLILFTKARESYNDYFSEKTLIELPIISHNSNGNQTDNDYSFSMNSFIDFLSERQGDFINALYYELKSHDFQTIPPPPPVPLNDQFSTLFKDAMETLDRRVVFLEPREINSSDFAFDFPFSVHSLIYKLIGLPISLKLDFRGSSGREFIHPQSSDFRIAMLQYVPSVSNGRMELPPVEIKSIRAPLNIFQKHLISSYRNQFIKEVVKVLFHADLLLNAVGVVKGVVGIFTDDSRSKKESLSNLGGQLLQSVEGIMRIIPSNIHLANSKTSKVSRFSKFIGNVANVLDKGADKINTTKRELIEEVIPSRQREPRAFPMGRITNITPICNVIDLETDNNEVENDNDSYGGLSEGFCDGSSLRFSIAQNTFQKLFSIKPDHANERLLALIDSGSNDNNNSNNKSHALAIFDHYIAVLSSNLFFVIIEARITDVISVDFKGSVVDLVIYNQHEEIETFNFNCKSESEARSIVTIISSISARMHIFAE